MNSFIELRNLIFIIPSLVNLVGWVTYIVLMKKKSIQPNPLPWLMSLIMISVCGLSLIANGGGWLGVMYLTGTIPAIFVFWMSIKYFTTPSIPEYLLLFFAVSLLVLSVFVPVVSMYSVSIYYILTYAVFVKKVWSGESIENPWPWGVWMIAGLSQLFMTFHIDQWALTSNAIIPLTLFLVWSLAFFSIIINRNESSIPS